MSKSNSSPTNTTSTSTQLTTKNLNVSGNSGFTAVGGEGGSQSLVVNNTTTDLGAVQASTGLASHALDIVGAANRDSISTVANFASKSLESTSSAYGTALTAVENNASDTVSTISNLASQFGTALYDFTNQEQTQLGNVVSALNSTYTANNTSANQQVINATTDVVKYAVLAAIGIAALYFLTRK